MSEKEVLACSECGFLNKGKVCENCSSNKLTKKFKGRVLILDTKNSKIAQKLSISKKGEYAITY